jgi:hypothetical protein
VAIGAFWGGGWGWAVAGDNNNVYINHNNNFNHNTNTSGATRNNIGGNRRNQGKWGLVKG